MMSMRSRCSSPRPPFRSFSSSFPFSHDGRAAPQERKRRQEDTVAAHDGSLAVRTAGRPTLTTTTTKAVRMVGIPIFVCMLECACAVFTTIQWDSIRLVLTTDSTCRLFAVVGFNHRIASR